MAGKVQLTDGESKALWGTAIGGLLLWLSLLTLPFIALNCSAFEVKRAEEVEQVKSIFSQLGTYGDLFGMLNCLFSGAALWGVVYAVILQRRELHHTHEAEENARRSTEIQNRLGLYQYLAEEHRRIEGVAGGDRLLAARSRGRSKAYAELIGDLLKDLNALVEGKKLEGRPVDYHDHPWQIIRLYWEYREDDDKYADPFFQFASVNDLLYKLVEEVAALSELNRGNQDAAEALSQAGHAVNAAIRPQDLLKPEQLDDAQFHRNYQVEKSKDAFNAAIVALDAFGVLAPLGIRIQRREIGERP